MNKPTTLLVVYCMCAGTAPASGGDPISKEVFLSEGKSSWMKYREYTRRLNGTSIRKMFVKGELKAHSELDHMESKRCRGLIARVLTGHIKGQEAYCQNPDYFFMLTRDLAKTEWTLTNLVLDKKEVAKQAILAMTRAGVDPHGIDDLIRPSGHIDLIGLLDYKHFVLEDVVGETIDDITYAKVAFRCPHPLEESPFVPVQAGILWLDPGSFWCLRRAELKVVYSGSVGTDTIEYRYRRNRDGIPIPEKIVQTYVGTTDGRKSASRLVFDFAVDLTDRPESDFYLSAFGLPEPVGIVPPPSRSRLHWWLFAGAAAAIVGGIWLRRRRRTASPTSAP